MPTMSERVLTDTRFLRQRSFYPSGFLPSRDRFCVLRRPFRLQASTVRNFTASDGAEIPRLAQQQGVEYRAFKRPDSHRRNVQDNKSDVTRNQDQSWGASYVRGCQQI